MGKEVTLGKAAVDDETSIKKLAYVVSLVSWWNSRRLILPFGYRFENARYRMTRQGANWRLLEIYDSASGREIVSEYINEGALQTVPVKRLLQDLGRMIFRWEGLRFKVDKTKAPATALLRTIERLKAANRQKRR